MNYLVLGLVFLAIPLYMLNTFVMPALSELQTTYQNIDTTADSLADVNPKH